MTGDILDQPTITADQRAATLLATMTLDEKMAQVSCYCPTDISDVSDFAARFPFGVGEVSCLEVRDAERLVDVVGFQRSVQTAAMTASGHRIPAIFHMEGLCGAYLPGAISFPPGLGRASSWDPDLEHQIGEIVGRQERSLGITHTFAPVLDVSRDPRMGRHSESYGEDATLAAALGVAYVNGLQSQHGDGVRSEAVAKHFLGFHHSEAGIHGAHCDIPERLLMEVYAKPFQAAITLAGLKGIMPCYGSLNGEPVSSSSWLLTRLLREEMGFAGMTVSDYGAIGNLHTVQRVADSLPQAGLSSMTAGMDAELHVPMGFAHELRDWFAEGRADLAILDQAVLRILATKFRMGLFEHPFALEGDELDSNFTIAGDRDVSLQSARESIILLRNTGILPLPAGPTTLAVIGCHAANARFLFGGYTHLSMAEGKVAAVTSMAGLAGSDAGKVAVEHTVPGTGIQSDDDPIFDEVLRRQQPGIRTLLDELRLRCPDREVLWAKGYPIAGDDHSGHAEALKIASQADVIILTLGGKNGTSSIASMGEGIDATNINLPACQERLIEKLAGLNKPMIGVHLDGRPISSDAADQHLDAIVEAWNPAEGGAQAIVDVLLGEVNPSGRLPVSVARNAGQVPVYYNHPFGSSWHQGESIGFPDYVDAPHTPRYHFGHGLSYTSFEYSRLGLSAREVSSSDTLTVTLQVRNTGDREGTETVQLYVRDRFASVTRPVLELAGFRRVFLPAGEAADVEFRLDLTQLAFLDVDMHWRVEEGAVDILIGSSSQDIRLEGIFRVGDTSTLIGRDRAVVARSTHRLSGVSKER